MASNFKLSLLVTCIFLISCKGKHHNSSINNKDTNISSTDTNKEKKLNKDSSSDWDTLFKDKNVAVIGNKSESAEDAIKYVAVRFKSYIRFDDFPASVANNKIQARIQYSSNPLAKEFRTAITTTYKKGVNFGGHYTFAEWGCGSPCQMSVLVDNNTGIVYDAVDGSEGFEFRKNSRMIIVNPPDSAGFYLNCPYCEPLIYIWDEKNKKFKQR